MLSADTAIVTPPSLPSRIVLANDFFFFFSSRRRHTRSLRDWSSDVCSPILKQPMQVSARETRVTRCGRYVPRTAREQVRQVFSLEAFDQHVFRRFEGQHALRAPGPCWRSEERRVGKGGRYGWEADREKKKRR